MRGYPGRLPLRRGRPARKAKAQHRARARRPALGRRENRKNISALRASECPRQIRPGDRGPRRNDFQAARAGGAGRGDRGGKRVGRADKNQRGHSSGDIRRRAANPRIPRRRHIRRRNRKGRYLQALQQAVCRQNPICGHRVLRRRRSRFRKGRRPSVDFRTPESSAPRAL